MQQMNGRDRFGRVTDPNLVDAQTAVLNQAADFPFGRKHIGFQGQQVHDTDSGLHFRPFQRGAGYAFESGQ